MAEDLGILADARRSIRGLPTHGRESDSSFDNLAHRSRTSRRTSVSPRVAHLSRRAESPPELVDQFENIGQRSSTSQVREQPQTSVGPKVPRPAQRTEASSNLLDELANERAEEAELERRLADLRLDAHRDSILGGGANQNIESQREPPPQSHQVRDGEGPDGKLYDQHVVGRCRFW